MVSFRKNFLGSLAWLIIVNAALAAKKPVIAHKKVGRANDPQHPQVQLKNGLTINGRVDKTVDLNKTYYSFRGIPFAEPPVGELRFKAPVPLSSEYCQKTIDAFKDPPPCVQSALTSIIGSEDCLYINVYTPQFPGKNASLLPVMVWIYGGAFVFGDGTYDSFGPDYFLDEGNVIIVTFNYRVGIFGFLSTEDAASPGNYGLKDQVLALKWVQQNIQAFGGNPKIVTIFGESAGSASVSYLTQTPLTEGLFHRGILESGTTLCLWALTRNPNSIAVAAAKILKVNTSTSQVLVDGLRTIPWKQLHKVGAESELGQLLVNNPLDGLPFGPTMEPPGPDAIVVNKSHEQLRNGRFHHVPYIMGFNSEESIPFYDIINYIRLYLLKYDLGPTALVPASMNIINKAVKDMVDNDIKARYFNFTPVTISEKKLLKYISDDEFNRPILEAALLYSLESPVYLYNFSYQGSLGSGNRTLTGVGHAEELSYLWRQKSNNAYATPSDILTRNRMVKFWTNFAKTGNPTPDNDSLLDNVKWPQANKAGKDNLAYLDIGKDLIPGVNPSWDEFQYWRELFNKYGIPPYSTY